MKFDNIKSKLKSIVDERKFNEILDEIDEEIEEEKYTKEEIMEIVKALLEVEIMRFTYDVRENYFNVLNSSIANYDIHSEINWKPISLLKPIVEEDLVEYIEKCERG